MPRTQREHASSPSSYSAPAVDGMLDIVEFLAGQSRAYGVSELAQAVELSTNMTFRVLQRLLERGYVEKEPDSDAYQLGPRFFSLGMRLAGRFDVRIRARRHLEHMARESGETAQLHIPHNGEVLVLDVVNAPVDFFLQVVPGSRLVYHANAFGKAILAFLDDAQRDAVLKQRRSKLTPNTLIRRADLEADLAAIRETGLAYDREEYLPGIYCIGAPVFGADGKVVGGTGVTGLATRFDANVRGRLERLVLRSAAAIARDIGYAGDFYACRGGAP